MVRRVPRRRGLTLFEVVIAIALIGLLLGTLLTFFWQTLAVREQAGRIADRTQIVQQMLERLGAELRNAVGLEGIEFPVTQFTGDRRRITFLTAPLPPAHSYGFYNESEAAALPAPRHDLREITYELWIDPEKTTPEGDPIVGGILRTERRAINPFVREEQAAEDQDLLYLRHDLWSHELGYLEFRYFDGVEWLTKWEVTEGNPLPHLVRVTVGFDSLTKAELEDQDLETYPLDRYPLGPDVPNINRFSVIVALPAADQMFTARAHRLGSQVQEIYKFGGPAQETEGAGGPTQETEGEGRREDKP